MLFATILDENVGVRSVRGKQQCEAQHAAANHQQAVKKPLGAAPLHGSHDKMPICFVALLGIGQATSFVAPRI
jgi:hypothetical protein